MCALNVAVTVMVAGDPTELQLVKVLTATVATMALRSLLPASGALPSLITLSNTSHRSLISPCRAPMPSHSPARPPTHTGPECDHHLSVASSSVCELLTWLAEGSAVALKAAPCASAEPRVLCSCACGDGTAWAARGKMNRARARAHVTLGNVRVDVASRCLAGSLLSRLVSRPSRGPRGSYA